MEFKLIKKAKLLLNLFYTKRIISLWHLFIFHLFVLQKKVRLSLKIIYERKEKRKQLFCCMMKELDELDK